jgi:hypothetical protein
VLGRSPNKPVSFDEYKQLLKDMDKRDLNAEEMAKIDAYEKWTNVPDTKFQQYTIPGGDNYREVLLKSSPEMRNVTLDEVNAARQKISSMLPAMTQGEYEAALASGEIAKIRKNPNASDFQSSHWDDPNVLAHLRMSDRVGDDGDKILHLEELQSDWGQQGRKEGFRDQNKSNMSVTNEGGIWRVRDQNGQRIDLNGASGFSSEEQARNALAANTRDIRGIPTAPYVTSTQGWTDLGLKRALQEATQGDYDRMIWTPGQQQADRYDLSKQIDKLQYHPDIQSLRAFKNGKQVIDEYNVPPEKVADFVGKDVAKNLLSDEALGKGVVPVHELRGQDLSVGGEGMKSYYDKIVPTRLSKIVGRLDPAAKIEPYTINTPNGPLTTQSIRITPQMRERIKKGLPAFKRGGMVVSANNSAVDRALALTRALPPSRHMPRSTGTPVVKTLARNTP